ncbi:hypothetical protein C7B65_15165 [Phormidesmis priestleyi ULC007]|uniref:Uncharacterized protein n=2 Tax=Phormidesmis priestleyi TaxID=268141 RepID=A0A2T1DD37_9CYAN|nr:hypothetical protein C7B65_15165 [Phormidesmis priestleyi ULC007]PZO48841.1 MAG: hypothetical protein DCF14_16025 [Phormidesmis priestleyi]
MAIEQALQSAASESGYNFTPSTPEQSERNDQIRRDLARKFGESLNDLGNALKNNVGNALKNPRNAFDDLFDRLADPFKKHPKTDPKNDDGRPKDTPTRYTYQWRGFKFYSVANIGIVHGNAFGGAYSTLGSVPWDEYHWGNPRIPGNRNAVRISFERLTFSSFQGPFGVERVEYIAEAGTIEPDPNYIPPSYQLPVNLPPGSQSPDVSGYPPIFTEDDFKPQRERNNDRARQDEADRQSAPPHEQEREEALDQQRRFAPDPWNDPLPIPTESPTPQPEPIQAPKPYPYPYPLDFPSPDPDEGPTDFPSPDPTAPPSERLLEKIRRIKRKLDERFPQPSNEPQTQVTINGKPVPRPNSSPPQRITESINPDEPYVTINGSPVPRTSNSPLPETRTQTPPTTTTTTTTTAPNTPPTTTTTTKPRVPVEPIIDPTTGLPLPSPDETTTTTTPDKCKDPCIQSLHDKADDNAKKKEITVRVFKACTKSNEDGTTQDEIDFEEETIEVPDSEADVYELLYERIFALESIQCDKDSCYAAVPDWWQIRLGADIPQAIVQYAEVKDNNKFGSPKYVVSIPHYGKSKEATKSSDFPTYTKGQRMGILTLRDNSKLIINASDDDVEQAIKKLQNSISPLWLTDSIYSDGKRKGTALKTIRVAPRIVKFFPTGQTDLKPQWIKYF